jgi:hypothetical protein
MPKEFAAIIFALLCLSMPAIAQEAPKDRVSLGYGRMFDNDVLGDGKDRWRTGAYTISALRGPAWTGVMPDTFGQILEYRLRTEIIAPENLVSPDDGDRRYAGSLSFGIHSHFLLRGAEVSLGAQLVMTGPQTGLSTLQREAHKLIGLGTPQVEETQIGNGLHPSLVAEVGRTYQLRDGLTLRPFAGAEAGVESLLRFGGDLVIGKFGQGGLMLRDQVTGQRYSGINGDRVPGLSLVMGGDVSRVFSSIYLPSDEAAVLSDVRSRLRAGVQWQGEKSAVFYGVTWLSKEFDAQPSGQAVGSLALQLRF